MLRPVPLALLFVLLAVCVPAQAHAYGRWEVGRAQAVAAAYWQGSPCASQHVSIVQSGAVPGNENEPFSAIVAYVLMDDTGKLSEGCVVHLTPALRDASWALVCTAMIHEYGHLAGRQHESAGIMAPEVSEPAPACVDRGRPFLGLKPSRAYERLRANALDSRGGYQ